MTISLICDPAPIAGRRNEDACFAYSDAETVTAVAIDGATQRIDVPALYSWPEQSPNAPRQTGATVAAQTTKHTMFQNMHRMPADMILAANAALRQRIERGSALDADALARIAPEHAAMLEDDPRLLRLMLPVCVVTVLQLDLATGQAHFAHVGDTALFVFYKDGRVSRITEDQMAQHDTAALREALAVRAELNAPHLRDVVKHERVVSVNQHNGLYHNYVDGNGAPDRSLGVGVINGLPEISAYIQTGTFALEPVAGLLVCSDGFPLPAPWNETPAQAEARRHTMRDLLFGEGIEEYFTHLRRLQAEDESLNRYPRFKTHDDSTGIFVQLGALKT